MVSKQNFFWVPSAAEIKKLEIKEIRDFYSDEISQCKSHEAILILNDLIPEEYVGNNKFIKHAPTIKYKRFKNLSETNGWSAEKLREDSLRALERNSNPSFSGITYKSPAGPDQTTRKFTLLDLLKATKMYAYAPYSYKQEPFRASTNVKPYDDARRVAQDGAEIIVRSPSRNNKPKYEMRFSSVPVFDNRYAMNNALHMKTSHMCKQKEFFIRYAWEFGQEKSAIQLMDSHEIAAFFAIIDFYANPKSRGDLDPVNLTPHKYNLFGAPTQELAQFYDKLEHNTIIKTIDDKTSRRLLDAEKEILLWHKLKELGHKGLESKQKLKTYDWSNKETYTNLIK